MATGTSVQEVIDFIGHDGSRSITVNGKEYEHAGYTDGEIAAYLLKHHMTLGAVARPDGFRVADGAKILDLKIDTYTHAILVVKSERFDNFCHTVYWDGRTVRDPNPEASDERMLLEYVIYQWWTINKLPAEQW